MTTVTGRLMYGAHTDAAGCKLLIAPARRMKGASWVTVPDKATPVTLGADGSFTVELQGGVWDFTEVIGAATHTERLVVPGSGSARYENLVPGSPTPDPTGGSYNLSIGTVTTGDAGTAAAATLTGQPPSQVLNLTIPRGVNGDGAVIKAGAGLTISGAGTAASPLVIAQADTGWRDVSSMLMNGWTATSFRARRIGCTVYVRPRGLNGKAATSPVFADLGSLVEEDPAADGIGIVLPGSPSFGYAYQWGGNGLWKLSVSVKYTEWVAIPTFCPVVAIPTSLPFPTTLPGTPA